MNKYITLPSDLPDRVHWYVYLRWFLLAVVSVSGLISLYVGEGWSTQVKRDSLLALAALGSNGVFYALSRLPRSQRYYCVLAIIMLVFDVLLITYFIFTKGGIESRSPILYTLPILMSAAILGRVAVYLTALGCLIAYNGLIVADYFNIIHSIGGVTTQRSDLPYVINSIIFFSAILLLIAFLADYVTRLLVVKEQQALATSEALKRAQAIAKLGSWEWNIPEDKITWSDELRTMFGTDLSADRASYKEYLRLIYPEDRPLVERSIQRALKKRRPFSFDHRVKKHNRSLRYIHAEGEVLTDKAGVPIKLYGTARDVTDDRVLEQAKGDFVSLASHQLRTPATNVKILLSLLTEGYAGELSARQKKLLKQAFAANERQLHIANDLLNVARVESGHMTLRRREINMNDWITQAVDELKRPSTKRVQKVMLRTPSHPVFVAVDPERLYMVVDNLLSNATKYTSEKGTITVTLDETNTAVRLMVTDTGVGIAQKDIRKLFQKFSRLDNRLNTEVEGSGLGLYLAQSIVKLHKGTITVRSKPGEGATFTVRLPKNNKTN